MACKALGRVPSQATRLKERRTDMEWKVTNELRWRCPPQTTTDGPTLQQKWEVKYTMAEHRDSVPETMHKTEWRDVPRVVD